MRRFSSGIFIHDGPPGDTGHEATHGTPHLPSSFFYLSSSPMCRLTMSFLLVPSPASPERPMKVEIVLDPSKAQPTPTLSERVGPAPATSTGTGATPGCVLVVPDCFRPFINFTFLALPAQRREGRAVSGKGEQRDRQRPQRIWMPRWLYVLVQSWSTASSDLIMVFIQDYTGTTSTAAAS
jgi:hypothetical protein